jgi:L-threonylcarbamoyladenylate synthase
MLTNNVDLAVKTLDRGDIIGFPTETVYGLAGNAYDENALKKIFILKQRPFYNPLIVHISSIRNLTEIATDIPDSAYRLAEIFWPGPLTLILKKKNHIPDIVTSGKDTVAIRVPNHPLALDLLNKLDYPLAAPSANPFGLISPTSAQHVINYFNEKLEVVLDGGECERGLESTIIGFENNQPILYRHGSISVEDIELVAGKLITVINNSQNPNSPGMLPSHYAPLTDTYLTNNVSELLKLFQQKKVGLLLFNKEVLHSKNIVQEVLSTKGDLNEAAKNLYAALHRLDQKKLDAIIAEKFPNEGLGKTINDRLQRAIKK